jgi:acetylornithine deacetylase
MLTGHIDVVPPGAPEPWMSDPFAPVVSEGFVRGRGTVDMKGGVACMLMAIEILKEIGVTLAGDVVFTTVVDEEIGGMGSLAMVDRGYRADAGIMTEPTANRIAPLCHGILWGRIIVDGIGGHAELTPNSWDGSGPVDAIELCRQVLDGIDILNRRWRTDPVKNHPLMDLPNQIIVTQIKAGEHPSSKAGLDPRLSRFGAHSDIGLPTGLGRTPTVNFGPGDPAQSHQSNERVAVRDLVDCTKAIALAIHSWRLPALRSPL